MLHLSDLHRITVTTVLNCSHTYQSNHDLELKVENHMTTVPSRSFVFLDSFFSLLAAGTRRRPAGHAKHQPRWQHHHSHGLGCVVPFNGWYLQHNHFKHSIRNRGGNINGQRSADQNLRKLHPRQLHDWSQLRRHAQVRVLLSLNSSFIFCYMSAQCSRTAFILWLRSCVVHLHVRRPTPKSSSTFTHYFKTRRAAVSF